MDCEQRGTQFNLYASCTHILSTYTAGALWPPASPLDAAGVQVQFASPCPQGTQLPPEAAFPQVAHCCGWDSAGAAGASDACGSAIGAAGSAGVIVGSDAGAAGSDGVSPFALLLF